MTANNQVAEANVKYLTEVALQTVPIGYSCPSGYKQTEVGVVPEDWNIVALKDIAIVKGGKRLPKGESLIKTPTSHPYIRVADMYNGGVDQSDLHFVPNHIAPIIKNYRIFAGELFISVAGTLGIVGSIPKELDGANLTENADRICAIKADPSFVLYCLATKRIQDDIASQSTIGAQPKLALGRIESFLISLPKRKEEQTAIANALSDVDALVSELEKLIAKKQAIKTATMQQLLTGRTRLSQFALREDGSSKSYKQSELGEIPEDWEVKHLRAISTMHGRIGWQGLKQEEFTFNDQQPFLITGMNFKDGEIRWDEVYHIPENRYEMDRNIQLRIGDILMTKDGTIGKLLYVDSIPFPGKATLNSHLLVFRPIQCFYFPKFLYYLMKTRLLEAHIEIHKSGSTFFGITQQAMGMFIVLLPSIEEQTAIATILSDMDEEIQTLQKRLAKTRQIKQGMMQELLTGKTRLVQPVQKEFANV